MGEIEGAIRTTEARASQNFPIEEMLKAGTITWQFAVRFKNM